MFVKIKVCIVVVWDFFVMDWLSDLVDVFVEVRNFIKINNLCMIVLFI